MKKVTSQKNVFAKIADAPFFQRFIIGIIVLAALLVGLETYHEIHDKYLPTFRMVDIVLQGIFTLEIIIRILAYGKHPIRFFKSTANNLDFIITAVFYLPFGGAYASVFRLVRIIRVLRLITAIPRLQILVGALIKSIPSMGYITLLLLIQMYIFAVLGTFLFGKTDPTHFGNVGNSILTLFQVITLEGWVDIMQTQSQPLLAPLYFISFILLGTMVVLNLFIGVILNGFEEVKKEIERELDGSHKKKTVSRELTEISDQLEILKDKLDLLVATKKKKKS